CSCFQSMSTPRPHPPASPGTSPQAGKTTGAFTYSNPRVIHWGAGSVAQLGAELQRLETTRIAVVTTRSLLSALDRLPAKPVATLLISQHAPMSEIDAGGVETAIARADGIGSIGGGRANAAD